jgi:hypothetical protein
MLKRRSASTAQQANRQDAGGSRSNEGGDETSSGTEIRYYYPSVNTTLLSEPFLVASEEDVKALLRELRNADVEATLMKDR